MWLSSFVPVLFPARPPLRGGKMGKEGFRGVPVRQCLDKTMPLIHPVGAATTLTLFVSMHTANSQVTRLIPPQRPSQGLPKLRIKKCFFCEHDERGFVIFSRPHGVFAVGSLIQGVHPVRTVDVITPFVRFIQGFLDRHIVSPSHLL